MKEGKKQLQFTLRAVGGLVPAIVEVPKEWNIFQMEPEKFDNFKLQVRYAEVHESKYWDYLIVQDSMSNGILLHSFRLYAFNKEKNIYRMTTKHEQWLFGKKID